MSLALADRFFTTSATWEASLYIPMGFPGVSDSEESAGDPGSIAGSSGRSLGEGHGNPLQFCCLENPMDRGSWQATVHVAQKSQTRLSVKVKVFVVQWCPTLCDPITWTVACQDPLSMDFPRQEYQGR